jgi:hypothetical protein
LLNNSGATLVLPFEGFAIFLRDKQ